MTRFEMVEGCLSEAVAGRPVYLMALLSYLRDTLGIPANRIFSIASRRFGIPTQIARNTYYHLRPFDTFR